MKKFIKKNFKWLLLFALAVAAILLAILWLDEIVYQFAAKYFSTAENETTRLGQLLQLVRVFGLADSVAILILCAGVLGWRRWGLNLILAFILVGATVEPLKNIVGRTRPNQYNTKSFPSGDTATAFTLPFVLSPSIPAQITATVLAGGVGFSRLMYNFHYLSDVLAGAIIGLLAGALGKKLAGKLRWLPPRNWLWAGLVLLLAGELYGALNAWHHRHVVQTIAWYFPVVALMLAAQTARVKYRLRGARIWCRALIADCGAVLAGLFLVGVWWINFGDEGAIRIPLFSAGLAVLYFAYALGKFYRYGRLVAAKKFTHYAGVIGGVYAIAYLTGAV